MEATIGLGSYRGQGFRGRLENQTEQNMENGMGIRVMYGLCRVTFCIE